MLLDGNRALAARYVEWAHGVCLPHVWSLAGEHNDLFHGFTIGFTAYKESSQTHDIDDVIAFERDVTNFGNSYDNQTGTFTCPVDAVYYVAVSLQRWALH